MGGFQMQILLHLYSTVLRSNDENIIKMAPMIAADLFCFKYIDIDKSMKQDQINK